MPILTKGTTFADGDQVTSTKLNNLVDAAVFRTGTNEAVDNATLLVDAGGYLKVGTVQTGNIATNAITTAKIADTNVTTAKIADSAVTTTKIAAASITPEKLSGAQSGSAPVFGVRAYASFNGTASSPITPISSGNVASITRSATGTYDVVLTTAMSSTSYCVVANATHQLTVSYATNCFVSITSATEFTITTGALSFGTYNSELVSFVVMQ